MKSTTVVAGQAPVTTRTCNHCEGRLLACPMGAACPGSDPLHPGTCRSCSWGFICPRHDRSWIRA